MMSKTSWWSSLCRKIRKFRLERCDLQTMIWNVSVLLRVLSINIDSRYKKRIPPLFTILTIVLMGFFYYTYVISMLWFVFVRSRETGDVGAAMVVLSLGMASVPTSLTMFLMYGYIKDIRKLVDECLECDSLVVPGSRFHSNLLQTLRAIKLRAMVYWAVIMSIATTYITIPFLRSGRHLMEDVLTLYGLEPKFETPNYEITNFLTGTSVVYITFATATITAFQIVVAGYTEAQLLALSEELTHVWKDSTKHYFNSIEIKIKVLYPLYKEAVLDRKAKKIINDEVKRRLVNIIKVHAKNIDLISQVEIVLNKASAIGFFFAIMSLITELLGGIENTYLQIPYSFSLVLMDCFIGQRIMDASSAFEKAVYFCEWENFDCANMKIILLMLQNAQKTLTLSAGGMAALNFATLMSFSRSVFSSYTTFSSTMQKHK